MSPVPKPFHHVDIIVGDDTASAAPNTGTIRHEFGPVDVTHTHKIEQPVRLGIGLGFGFMAGRTLYRLIMLFIVYGIILLLGLKLYSALGF